MYDGIKTIYHPQSPRASVTAAEASGGVRPTPDDRWRRSGLINPAERRKAKDRRRRDDQRVSGFNLRSGRDRRKNANRHPKIEIQV
ncbi:MAG: hypothetical protein COA42_00850 [Alteromonadaceae bacterium]|nr:MAG: hypothetical protein COA42_00850 [Alteromonadaceae bacterium]